MPIIDGLIESSFLALSLLLSCHTIHCQIQNVFLFTGDDYKQQPPERTSVSKWKMNSEILSQSSTENTKDSVRIRFLFV